jgi:manganese/zinc/iron transport system permease protein
VLSVFFGVGILLLTYIRKTGNAAQSGLDKFLFGQAASLIDADVYLLLILSSLICGTVLLAYKEFKLISFDAEFAAGIGMPVRLIEIVMATLIVLAVAIGLQAVGVVLMAAMLVTPAAAARYWSDRLGVMLGLAAVFGAISGALGAYISYLSTRMPTGPWMVVAVTTIFLVSLVLAPRRGLLGRYLRHRRFRARTNRENILRTLYLLGEKCGQWDHFYSSGDLLQHRPMSTPLMARSIAGLKRGGFARENDRGYIALTEEGVREAARVTRLHRLWELYLTRKLEIAPDHVHDDAEEVEHILTPELEARLVAMLEHPEHDPHGETIPGVTPVAEVR